MGYLPGKFEIDLNSAFESAALMSKMVGAEFQDSLKAQLETNPHLLDNYTTHETAQTLMACRRSWRGKIDEDLLLKIYAPFNIRSDHLRRAMDLDQRAQLMQALIDSDLLEDDPNSDRLERLNNLNNLHSQIFGFKKEQVTTDKRPEVLIDGVWVLGNGGRDIATKLITLNTHIPTNPDVKMTTTFYKSWQQISCLVLHEGRHTYQDYIGSKAVEIQDQELKDWATVMYFSTEGNYYIRGTNEVNRLNPSEKDAYDFEDDMKKFYEAAPDARRSMIMGVEMRRDAHRELAKRMTTPQLKANAPAFEIAA